MIHAMLLVRIGRRFWILDNRSDRLATPADYPDFYPILTFSGSHTWLHGYRIGSIPPAVVAIKTAFLSRWDMVVGGGLPKGRLSSAR